jgi:hypothetical protein
MVNTLLLILIGLIGSNHVLKFCGLTLSFTISRQPFQTCSAVFSFIMGINKVLNIVLLQVINENLFVNINGLFVFATSNPKKNIFKISDCGLHIYFFFLIGVKASIFIWFAQK